MMKKEATASTEQATIPADTTLTTSKDEGNL